MGFCPVGVMSVYQLNDYQKVVLTSIIAKCMERLVFSVQFAYNTKRGVEDANSQVDTEALQCLQFNL